MRIHQLKGLRVRASKIPDRRSFWSAVDHDTYDTHGGPVGFGFTEADAIEDLIKQNKDRAALSLAKGMNTPSHQSEGEGV